MIACFDLELELNFGILFKLIRILNKQ